MRTETAHKIGKWAATLGGILMLGLAITTLPGCFAVGDGNLYSTDILNFGY